MNELEELDAWNVELWADDPDVEFVDAPLDRNAKHGQNTEEEMNG